MSLAGKRRGKDVEWVNNGGLRRSHLRVEFHTRYLIVRVKDGTLYNLMIIICQCISYHTTFSFSMQTCSLSLRGQASEAFSVNKRHQGLYSALSVRVGCLFYYCQASVASRKMTAELSHCRLRL